MRKLLALLFVVAACSTNGDTDGDTATESESEAPLAIVANTDLAVGPQRVLLGLRSHTDAAPLEEPTRQVEVDFFAPNDTAQPFATRPADFIWLVPDLRGVYVTTLDFPEPGLWGVSMAISDLPDTGITPFQVFEDALTPDVGDEAPKSKSLTLADRPIESLTSDPEPDPRLYELSLDEALSSGRPTLVVFSTPAFCQTATCGPTLDVAKGLRDSYPAVDFVHVEVFDLTKAPDQLITVQAVDEWKLPSEPWVFVVDATGVVSARFEGVASEAELKDILDQVGLP